MSEQPTASAPRPPRGRRPGQSTTRQVVLDAARARFAADGFNATTIRRIAADAGVDAALVMRYFRSKDELFAAVMSISPDALARLAGAFEGPEHSLGERVPGPPGCVGESPRMRMLCSRCSAERSRTSRRPRNSGSSSSRA
ncbi:helix-turn-helix domain-containing protein [Streptomyces sp. NPDC048445]|uniref:helix-turn-helix domain-containing protein n=1 Tax=Streptomyces sp. NPDC048445 TaxID=3365553 RepID=UPI00370FA28C